MTADTTRAALEFQTVLTLTRAVRAWTRAVDRELREKTGQTRVRWETLFAIAAEPVPTKASLVARRMGVQWPALVRNLEGLEDDGLILRQLDPEDNRSRLIELTQAGHDVIAEVRATLDPARARLLAGMSDTDLSRIIDSVGEIRDRLEGGALR